MGHLQKTLVIYKKKKTLGHLQKTWGLLQKTLGHLQCSKWKTKHTTLSEQYNYWRQEMTMSLNKVHDDQTRHRPMYVVCISFSSLLPIQFDNDIYDFIFSEWVSVWLSGCLCYWLVHLSDICIYMNVFIDIFFKLSEWVIVYGNMSNSSSYFDEMKRMYALQWIDTMRCKF